MDAVARLPHPLPSDSASVAREWLVKALQALDAANLIQEAAHVQWALDVIDAGRLPAVSGKQARGR